MEILVNARAKNYVAGNQDAADLTRRGRERTVGETVKVVCKMLELPMPARSNFSGRLWAGSTLKISRCGGRNGVLGPGCDLAGLSSHSLLGFGPLLCLLQLPASSTLSRSRQKTFFLSFFLLFRPH